MTRAISPEHRLSTRARRRTGTGVLIAFVLLVVACSAPPQTTRTEAEDFIVMSQQIASEMLATDAIGERRPESEPWVVVADRFENLSSEVIPHAEQQAITRRIIAAAPLKQLSEQKNITFVVTTAQTGQLSGSVTLDDDLIATARQPTHSLAVVFRSATRAQAKDRTDAYFIEYVLTDVRDGTLIWSGDVGYKRVAKGHIWD